MAEIAPSRRKLLALAAGLMCHGLFAAAVVAMIYGMYFGMSLAMGRVPFPWSLFANAALLLQFPLTHSGLLTARGQRLMRMIAPGPAGAALAPTLFVIVASLQTLLLFSLWTPSGVVWWRAEGTGLALLLALYAASWLMLGKAISDAGLGLQTGAIGWLALYRGTKPNYPPMPARGLFRLCRQPIYLAFALTLWTVPTWTPDQLVIASILSFYCLVGPLLKEERFRRRFGAEFATYQSRHPYFLPWPSPARRNDLTIYDQYASHWWDGSVRWLRTLQNLVPARLAYFDTLTDWKGKRVLDLGSGGGFMAEALARRGANVTGLDPASGAIAIAQAHAAGQGLDIAYLTGSGESLPFDNDEFDIVVCVDVLEHVDDLDRVLAEIHRVLRPGGMFLFDTINRNGLASFVLVTLAEDVLRLVPRGTHDPAKFIRPGEIAGKLVDLGFVVTSPVGLGPRGLNHRLDIIFGRLPAPTIMYMGSARKQTRREEA